MKPYGATNIQSALDYDTKLLCTINVSKNRTAHYEIPNITKQAIRNINNTLKYISTNTIYLNQISLFYWADKKNKKTNTKHKNKEKNRKIKPESIPQRPF